MSTVLCISHLLSAGFHFVLTAKFASDEVESLFSTIGQLNGSNDQTDACAALSALQKILVTGIIHSSASANVGSVVGSLGKVSELPPAVTPAPPEEDLKELLSPHLAALAQYPETPHPSPADEYTSYDRWLPCASCARQRRLRELLCQLAGTEQPLYHNSLDCRHR